MNATQYIEELHGRFGESVEVRELKRILIWHCSILVGWLKIEDRGEFWTVTWTNLHQGPEHEHGKVKSVDMMKQTGLRRSVQATGDQGVRRADTLTESLYGILCPDIAGRIYSCVCRRICSVHRFYFPERHEAEAQVEVRAH